MTIATWTGEVLVNGTPLGKRGTLIATPEAEGTWVNAGDHIAHGSAKAETDGSGVIQGGLDVEDVPGLLYTLIWEPHDNSGDHVLGTFDLTGGGDIAALVETEFRAVSETDFTAIGDAIAAVASINREASGGIMGIGSDGKVADGKRLSTALMGLNVLNYGTVTAGGDILAALNAAIAAAARSSSIASPKVFVPYVNGGYLLSDKPTLASGVKVEGGGYVTLKLSASRTRMFDFTGITDASLSGFTFDLNGNITGAGAYLPSTAADIVIDDNRWINTKTTVRAVTNKVLTSNVVTLTLDNTGANPIGVGNVVSVYGVNGLSALSYADAGVFNNASATVTAATSTSISYAKTNADVASTAVSAGWVTNGQAASIYAINCESTTRPVITRNVMTGIRGGVRLFEATVGARVTDNQFYGWGDRGIFGLNTSSGQISDTKILRNTFGPPSQFYGDPHQSIAFQGVAGFWHDGVECASNVINGATSGGFLIGHHTGRSNNDLLGGTADAISFHHTKNLHIHHNIVRNSGEVGITVSNDCTQFNIHDNTVDGSNSTPYALDWGTGSSFVGIGSALHSNTAINGSQERGQAATGNTNRTGVRSAFWLAGPTGLHVHDNVALDNQGTPTQTSAFYIKDAISGLTIGKTSLQGGTTLLLNASSAYTGTIDFYTTGAAAAPQVDTFTTAGTATWTKPAGAVKCDVIAISGGSGGGSGRRGAAASIRAGGAGGAGGVRMLGTFLASDLGATETVTVGAGGAGGTAQTVDSTNGVDGSAGGLSGFGATGTGRWLTAPAGNGGTGGAAGATAGGTAAAPGGSVGGTGSATGGPGGAASNSTGKGTHVTAGAGGGGGGITTADVEGAGGNGGISVTGTTTAPAGGSTPGGAGAVGTATKANSREPGTGGAGGAASKTTAGGAGGAGSTPGGGGGGGGASLNGFNSGAGGAGADGAVYVVTYFS